MIRSVCNCAEWRLWHAFSQWVICAASAAAAAVCDGGYIIHRRECRQLSDFDYVVVNKEGQLEECVDKLCAIIDAERLRTHSNSATAAPQQ